MQHESVRIINKSLRGYLDPYHTISIIGIAKNAGKTTVMNAVIEEYKDEQICITSIGLDGEKIDNITHQEKPQIKAYKGMYVVTAEDCLKESTIEYQVHCNTSIRTALGPIVIIEVTKTGLVLVAGPSSRMQMKKVLNILEKFKPVKILIDGALYRKSIANTELADAVIFVTGASYSSNLETVVKDSKEIIDHLSISKRKIPKKLYENIDENVQFYYEKTEISKKELTSLINNEQLLEQYIEPTLSHIYFPGALTDRICEYLVKNNQKLNEIKLIVQDSSFLLLSPITYRHLQHLKAEIIVLRNICIPFVAYNPTSPYSYDFNDKIFKEELQKVISFDIINVLKELG